MTFLSRKTISEKLLAHAQDLVQAHPPRDTYESLRGHARDYAGQAGALTRQAIAGARGRVSRRTGLGVAIGVGIGLGALATAWLLARRKALTQDEYDEHDPTRYRPTNASGDALDGTGEDNPIPGETGLY